MADFTWWPDGSTPESSKPRVKKAQFGDGYSQRAGDGINTDLKQWSLSFSNRAEADIDLICAFLEGKGATTAFTFQPPKNASEVSVICESWTRDERAIDFCTVRATFKQVPA